MTAPNQARPSGRRRRLPRSGWVAAAVAAAATLGCQAALTERNPASELIWWVSGAVFLVLAVILVVEVGDWLWLALRRLRGRDRPPGPVRPGDSFHLRDDDRSLRRRHLWRARPVRRTWGEGRTEADPEAER